MKIRRGFVVLLSILAALFMVLAIWAPPGDLGANWFQMGVLSIIGSFVVGMFAVME